jgi:hypothetical protein
MRLGIKMLNSSSTLNDLKFVNQVSINQGDTATIMFQLIDLDTNQRYIPATGAGVMAKIASSNSANVLNKVAVAAFADDKSVVKFSLTIDETKLLGSVNLQITLTEGSEVKSFVASSVIIPAPKSPFQC